MPLSTLESGSRKGGSGGTCSLDGQVRAQPGSPTPATRHHRYLLPFVSKQSPQQLEALVHGRPRALALRRWEDSAPVLVVAAAASAGPLSGPCGAPGTPRRCFLGDWLEARGASQVGLA